MAGWLTLGLSIQATRRKDFPEDLGFSQHSSYRLAVLLSSLDRDKWTTGSKNSIVKTKNITGKLAVA
jgi:hypothetical protein